MGTYVLRAHPARVTQGKSAHGPRGLLATGLHQLNEMRRRLSVIPGQFLPGDSAYQSQSSSGQVSAPKADFQTALLELAAWNTEDDGDPKRGIVVMEMLLYISFIPASRSRLVLQVSH